MMICRFLLTLITGKIEHLNIDVYVDQYQVCHR